MIDESFGFHAVFLQSTLYYLQHPTTMVSWKVLLHPPWLIFYLQHHLLYHWYKQWLRFLVSVKVDKSIIKSHVITTSLLGRINLELEQVHFILIPWEVSKRNHLSKLLSNLLKVLPSMIDDPKARLLYNILSMKLPSSNTAATF